MRSIQRKASSAHAGVKDVPKISAEAKLNQAARQGLSARIKFARANIIFSFAICFRSPR